MMRDTEFEDEQVFDLREYLKILRRRRGIVLTAFITVVLATGLITWRMTPIYEGAARVEVQPASSSSSESSRVLESLVDPTRALQTQVELIKSKAVLALAAKDLGLPSADDIQRALSVELVRDTQIVEIKVDHERPEEARDWANAVANSYIEFRRNRAIDNVLAATEDLSARIETVKSQITDIDKKNEAAPTGTVGNKAERDRLVAQLSALEAQRATLPDTSALERGSGSTITSAETPKAPIKPRKIVNMFLAVVIGAMLGIGLAFLAENLDDRMKSPEEVEERVGAPNLGYIPYVHDWTKHPNEFVAAINDPSSGAAEAFRTLRTNLRFVSLERPLKTLVLTSAIAGVGKTTTAANLAVTIAQSGSKVILVSADLRKPTLHKLFGLSNTTGIADALDPSFPLANALQATSIPNFRVLAAGGLLPNPTEILASPRFTELIHELEAICDLVIIDTPPVLGLGDTSALVSRIDGVLFVIDTKQVTRRELKHALEQMRKSGGRVIGSVLNAVEAEEGYGYYYNYYYTHYEMEAEEEAKRAAGPPNGKTSSILPKRKKDNAPSS